MLLRKLTEPVEVKAVGKVEATTLVLVQIPEDIGLDSIQAGFLAAAHQLRPERRRTARIMNGATQKEDALPINGHRTRIIPHERYRHRQIYLSPCFEVRIMDRRLLSPISLTHLLAVYIT